MYKVIRYLSLMLCCFMLFILNVNASSYSVSLTSNSVTVGNSVTLTINGDNMAGRFNVSSSNTSVASLSQDFIWVDDSTGSITIKTSKVGTSVITISPYDVTDYDGNSVEGNKTVTITVKNKPTSNSGGSTNSYVPPKKSTNNYLTSLTIDEFSLDSKFDKDTLEYSVTVPAETEKININAQLADSSAKVEGIGEKNVNVGTNVFEIRVTAENGDVKTYKLTITVLEPTSIKVDNKNYTIVEKEGVLDLIDGYEKSNVKIGEEEYVSYYNEKTKYNLVILKDEEGNSNYYLYEDGKYSLYKEYNFSGVRLHLLDSKVPDNYVEREFTINDEKIKAYQINNNKKNATYALDNDVVSNYYLVYAMNVNTGNKNFYLIDKLENTVIRYDKELNNLFLDVKQDEKYKNYFFITLGAFGFVIVGFGISVIINGRKKSNRLNFK